MLRLIIIDPSPVFFNFWYGQVRLKLSKIAKFESASLLFVTYITSHYRALSQETITWLPTVQEAVHAYKTWALGGLNYVMTLAFMTLAKFYENGKWRDWGIQLNNNRKFFCLKETKLIHVQATEGKCSKLPLPFLSNLALQPLIIKVIVRR